MYNTAEEDPSVYSDEEDFDVGFVLHREWKEVPLPSKPKEEDKMFKYLAEAQRAHDFHASLLAMHGIDACKVSKLSKVTTVLENVTKDDRTCNICHKGLAGAQSLKSHIRVEHVGKTKHHCKPCDKYFAEASSLKIHNRKHRIGAMFPCTKCRKQFRRLDVSMNISILTSLPRSEVMPSANPVAKNSFIVDHILIMSSGAVLAVPVSSVICALKITPTNGISLDI